METFELTKLIATSVVRGSHQGESHGGIYLVDLDENLVAQPVDWNTADIDWQGRGWDRGLRGIAFDGERIYIAASDELFVYDPDFNRIDSFRNPYLKHCHEISRYQRRLYLTSTGFDSILGFDLDSHRFSWGLHIAAAGEDVRGQPFNPHATGPPPGNALHLNSVHCTAKGMFISGMRTPGLLRFGGRTLELVARLPEGTHNVRPHLEGILFNDTRADRVRFVSPTRQRSFAVPRYEESRLTHTDLDDSRIARQSFGRGLCAINDSLIAAGSSPSTVTLHDLHEGRSVRQITLSLDIRNAIHGLEVWPF